MLRSLLLAIILAIAVASAYEQRVVVDRYLRGDHTPVSLVPLAWHLEDRASLADVMTVTIALAQKNLDKLEAKFWAVSNPKGKDYGKYLSFEEVSQLVRPSADAVNAVRNWLINGGVSPLSIELKPGGDFLVVHNVPAFIMEKLLQVELHRFRHVENGKAIIRSLKPYSVPASVAKFIDFIGSVNRFPKTKHRQPPQPKSLPPGNKPIYSRIIPGDGEFSAFMLLRCANGNVSQNAGSPCSEYGTPIASVQTKVSLEGEVLTFDAKFEEFDCRQCVNWTGKSSRLYLCTQVAITYDLSRNTVFCSLPLIDGIRNYVPANVSIRTQYSDGSQSAAAQYHAPVYTGKFVTPRTLTQRYQVPEGTSGSNPMNSRAVAEFLDQYYSPDDLNGFFDVMGIPRQPVNVIGPNDPTNPGGEASLDIQYIMGVAPNVSTTFWSLGGLHDGQEPFDKWITDVIGSPNASLVHSISYGDDEDSLAVNYMTRINTEFQKAGVMGLSLFFSSGDNGVASANESTPGCPGHWIASFPASSPYVTAVGATQFSTYTRPVCSMAANGVPTRCEEEGEIMSSTTTGSRITSGGGFSNVFSRPQYQGGNSTGLVAKYIGAYLNDVPSSWYNAQGRAYPDVAACGRNFIVVLDGQLVPVDGTSAAAPTFAAIASLLNDMRLNLGLSPLGFMNPLIYQVGNEIPTAFFDIVMGTNNCPENLDQCCEYGLPTVVGWDATTGFGTPNFAAWAQLLS